MKQSNKLHYFVLQMVQSKKIKILLSAFMLLLACWIAVPKIYIHQFLHHTHISSIPSSETEIKSQSTDDCEFEKYDKPAYFNIFKVIFSFLPVRTDDDDKVQDTKLRLSNFLYAIPLFRGPPASN